MNAEDQRLDDLKKRMSPAQRQQMADLLSAELQRRESVGAGKKKQVELRTKSAVKTSSLSGLSDRDSLSEFYKEVGDNMRAIRGKTAYGVPAQAANTPAKKLRSQRPAAQRSSTRRLAGRLQTGALTVFYAIVACGALKVAFSTGLVSATATAPTSTSDQTTEASLSQNPEFAPGQWSPAEKKLLTQLDARRVELEQRNEQLDKREQELKLQSESLAERIAELKSLAAKIETVRLEQDHRKEARLEQLANVYGSMAPNEAAPLIARLDDELGLSLLQRMPGKRMGQILSLMDRDRAVALTRKLSDKAAGR